MVTHHGKPEHFNAHDSREKLQPLPDEFATRLVISARERITPTKKRPPHASIDAMHHLYFAIRQHIPAIRACHDRDPQCFETHNSHQSSLSLAECAAPPDLRE